MKKLIILFLFIVGTITAKAQIKPRVKDESAFILKSIKELRLPQDDTKTEIAKKIAEIVKPVIDKLGKLMDADPATYKAYQQDIKAIADAKTNEEKRSGIANVSKKYYPFIKKVWEEANIDERDYQAKIRAVFPDNVKDKIKFSEFLRFQYELAKPVQGYTPGGGGLQTSNTPPIVTKPDDPNPFRCIDEIPSSGVLFDESKSGIGFTNHWYGEFTDTDPTKAIHTFTTADGPWGRYSDAGITLDTVSIPGRFPSDSRRLQVTKSYKWNGSAYAISVLGTSLGFYYETPFFGASFSEWQTEVGICSPITFVLYSERNLTKTYSVIKQKPTGNFLAFGFGAGNYSSGSGLLAFAGAQSNVAGTKWTLCEIP